MNRNIGAYVLLAAPSVFLFFTLWGYMLGDPFPPFNDPGIWLKLAHALEGNAYPMWAETTYQYPPLMPAILGLVSYIAGNELVAEKIVGAALIALIPLSSYPLAKAVTGNAWLGVVGAWLVAFAPIFQEMFGWGGYPDALGIVFLSLAMGYAVIAYYNPTRLNLALTAAFSFLTPLAHHLTFIMFAGGFGLATLFLFFFVTRERKKLYAPIFALAAGGAGFALWRILAGPFQYQLYNGASLAIRPLDLSAIQFTFKSPFVLTALVVLAAVGGFWLYRNKKYFELLLLVSVAVIPYIAAQSYLVGIALDFRRYPAFSAIPLSILAACSLAWLRGGDAKPTFRVAREKGVRLEGSLSIPHAFIALAFIFLFVGTVYTGVRTEGAVFAYYHAETDYTYQGTSRLQAINWLKANTSSNAVIVADETMGRWTEGYGDRRVLLDLEPYQSFITGEVPRAIAADLILSASNAEIANPSVRVEDGTPDQLGQTPVFAWSDGLDYHNSVYVTDAYVRAYFARAGSNWIEAPYGALDFSMSWLSQSATNVTLGENYVTGGLIFNKTTSMGLYSPAVYLTYHVAPKNGSVLQTLQLPIWIPFGDTASLATVNSTSFTLTDNGVPISITPIGTIQSATFGVDNSTGQQRLLLQFAPVDNKIAAGFVLAFPNAAPIAWRSTLDSYLADQLIQQYQVGYIAVGIYHYNIQLYKNDPRFTLVYQNAQIAIFQVKAPG